MICDVNGATPGMFRAFATLCFIGTCQASSSSGWPGQAAEPGKAIPADLVTTSASGLDPAAVRGLVDASVERPLFGILGEPRVYVVELNRRLDAIGVRTAPRP